MSTEKDSSKREFLSEAEEILEEITSDLQMLESSLQKNNVRPELINKLFREFHSLKGIAGMLGFSTIANFTHELENMLDQLRLGKIELSSGTIDVLYQSLDLLSRMIRELDQGTEENSDPAPLLRKVEDIMKSTVAPQQRPSFPDLDLDEQTIRSLTEYEEHRLRENLRSQSHLYSLHLALDSSTFDQDLRQITDVLSRHGEIVSTLPYFDMDAGPDKMLFRLLYGTAESKDSIGRSIDFPVEIFDLRKGKQPEILPKPAEEEQEVEKISEDTLKSLSNTVRVDIHKLDDVINIIGDLVITRSAITSLSRELMTSSHTSSQGVALSRTAMELEKKLNDLQRSVIDTRLVPIGQIYNKLGRMVRKLSRETGKNIELQMFGEDTRLDKIMIEHISDPLMHIIRNAIDHGIESRDERRRMGKAETGLIKLSAFQRGNNVVIQIQDDGRGIQVHRVQEQAVKRGLIPADHLPDTKECIDIIFSPGFSSSDQVTEISGRGVGLDVVKRNIAELKGFIHVYTEEGHGTVFEITLPITLAIIQALLVKLNGSKYAVPLSSVTETVRIFSKDIQTVDRKEVYYLRDRTIPLIRVADVFGLPRLEPREKLFMVLVELSDQHFGLVVDELAGQQEIVIKSMGEKLKNIPGVAGAAEIGEKKPILVIDAESMIEEVTQGKVRVT